MAFPLVVMPSAMFLLWLFATVKGEPKVEPNEVNLETQPKEDFPWSHPRLPTTIRPDQYFLSLHPALHSETFSGKVVILVSALNDTNLIVLNSKGLDIKEASLRDLTLHLIDYRKAPGNAVKHKQMLLHQANRAQEESMTNPVSLRVLESEDAEQLALLADSPLIKGHQYQLFLSYSGRFSSSYSGLYKSTYQKPGDEYPRTIIATQFEPSSARKAFPCFDEPDMKAVFSLSIVRQREHISLSNMPKLCTKALANDLEEDYFETSVKMSSYLMAFVVCDYDVNSSETKRGVKVSVFAGSHHINQTQHALQAAVKMLDFYEEYFQIPYPLPKLDLVAIPEFESGAMENWGLIMFRETSLLYEEQSDTLSGQLWICLVTAHELTHQWFGNLVTMQWWNNLWLNEGFASYMEYIAIRHLEPTWDVEEHQLLRNTYRALEKDSLVTSHPLSLPVNSSTKIREMFDVISYSKGASILCMLHTYLSDHVFVSGIQQYLRAHSYNNAMPDDLWKALSEAAQLSGMAIDVKALMDTWITQRGYPVVAVSVRGNQIHLRQNLFTILAQNDSDSVWQIPFTFYTSSSTNVTTHLMTSKEEIIDLPGEVAWIKGNVNSNGFYRVSYDSHTLRCLLTQLQGALTGLSASDRAGLIDDSFQLARQGTMQYGDAFTTSLYLKKEEEFLPITVFINHMINMIVKFSFKKKPCITHLLKEHLWNLLGPLARAQLWEDAGSLSVQSRRVKLLELAVRVGRSPATEQEAVRLFHFWMAKYGHHPLPRTLRGLVFRVGIMRGGHDEWMFLIERYCICTSNKERVLILTALCHTTRRSKILWLLSTSLRNHVIKTQDFSIIVEQLVSQPNVYNLVWKFLQNNWDTLVLKFPLGSSYLSGIVTITTSHFICAQKYNEVYDFFVTQKKLSNLHFVRRSLEMIQVNMHWLKTNTEIIQSWLQKAYPTTFKTYPYCKKDVTYRFKWGTTIHIRV